MRHLSTLLILLSINISLVAQSIGVNLPDGTTANTMLDVNGGVSFREGTALTCVNGVNNNIALANYSFYRITGPTAAFSITGFGNGTDGRCLTIINASGQSLTLSHLTTSIITNQINTGGSAVVLPTNGVATLIYNANLVKWIVSGTMGTAPSFASINNGSFSDSMLVINNGVPLRVRPVDYIKTYAWGIDGNTGTTAGTNFVGTTDAQSLVFKTNNIEGMRISATQNVGINTTTPQYKLDINAQTGSAGNPLRLLGLNAGATSDSIMTASSGIVRRMSMNNLAWTLTGNSGTVDGTNFIGTSDNVPLSIRVNNQKAGRIDHILNNAFWGYQAGNAMISGTNNVAMGSTALSTMTTGNENIAIGGQSGFSNTTGVRNVSIGYQSARNGTHSNSVMIGYQAGLQNAASNNVFIGSLSGPFTSTGADNIGMGYYTLFGNTTGKNNLAIGSLALSGTTTSWGNTAVGYLSSASIQTGQANTALGDSSLMNNILGSNNTALGYRAGLWTTGSNNIVIGNNAAVPVSTADNQLALGNWLYGASGFLGINTINPQYKLDIDANTGSTGNPLRLLGLQAGATSDSMMTVSSGILRRMSMNNLAWTLTGNSGTVDGTNFLGTTDNVPLSIRVNNQKAGRIGIVGETYLGYQAGNVATGINNTAIGYQALLSNSTGAGNVAVGYEALKANTTSSTNTAVGYQAGKATTGFGQNNTFVGYQAGLVNTSGISNSFFGYLAGTANTTGTNNTGFGSYSLATISTGADNTAFGPGALGSTTTGNYNVALGTQAGSGNAAGQYHVYLGFQAGANTTSGDGNTFIGHNSAQNVAISNSNTLLGYLTNMNSGLTNATAIGANASVTASNSLVLGGTGANIVNVGIGLTAPINRLDVEGAAVIGVAYAGASSAPTNGLLVEGNVGIGTTTVNAKLDVSGSVGYAITTTAAATLTLDATHHTVIINTGATTIITLPAASTCARRIYVIVNRTAAARTISTYQTIASGTSTTIATSAAMTIQSDGTNWYRIQ